MSRSAVQERERGYDFLGVVRCLAELLCSESSLRFIYCIALSHMDLHDDPFICSRSAVQERERGYDFLGVVRWLAEHADVVLLFFDPDKPGEQSCTDTQTHHTHTSHTHTHHIHAHARTHAEHRKDV